MQRHLKNSYFIFFTFFLFQLSLPNYSFAQREYQAVHDIPLAINGQDLPIPWAGGLNAPLLQTADLDGDGQEELIAFDRTSQSLLVFGRENGNWRSRQELTCLMPPGISNWFIMQDYDNDGQKDIFTYTSAGIRVFRNTSLVGDNAAWELAEESLSYESNGRLVNLLVNSSDVPAIEDVDGDGDMDVLIFDPSGGGGLQYYRNQGQERNASAGEFLYILESRHWGGLSECNCQEFAYNGETCENKGSAGHRVMHIGGKSLLLFDVDADGDYDLLNGFELCEELYYLENKGSNTEPLFQEFKTSLPGITRSSAPGYPAAFAIDVQQDGLKDLIVSSQLGSNGGLKHDFSQSVWWYQPLAKDGPAEYMLQTKAFLQENMPDAGEWSVPAFADTDGDGDQDLILGTFGKPQSDGFYAGLMLFVNTGTPQNPSFELKDEDYLNIKKFRLIQLKPQFADFNKDGSLDLVLIATETKNFRRKGYLFLNSAPKDASFNFSGSQAAELSFNFASRDNPFFYDINGDGLPDLLAGKGDGSLSFYNNEGTESTPSFGQEVKNFLGVGLDNYRRPLIPSVGDLTGNGLPDLLLADGTGSIRYVENLTVVAEGTADLIDLSVCEGPEAASWFGRQSWPVAVQLSNKEAPALVVGSLNGGLWLLKTDVGPNIPEGEGLEVVVYPNPVNSEEENVFVKSNLPVNIKIFSVRGQLLQTFDLPANIKAPIPEEGLTAGLYVLKAEGAAGKQTRKFILLK